MKALMLLLFSMRGTLNALLFLVIWIVLMIFCLMETDINQAILLLVAIVGSVWGIMRIVFNFLLDSGRLASMFIRDDDNNSKHGNT